MQLPLKINTSKRSQSKPMSSVSSIGSSGQHQPTTSIYRQQHEDNEATTSIYRAQHAGQKNQPSTSIAHATERSQTSVAHTYEEEQESDELRYDYIRRVIKERKQKEKDSEKKKNK